ncbi:MAG: carboxypeptidase regulatory-like domain-containing protein [Bryobacterales bacterium]|nr:carboxypeptidase regulatory-like domain-containing protein [Bryobacterales bacterium]
MLRNTSVLLLATLIGGAANATGAELKLFGSITGQVRNTAGTTQMGATVLLMNRNERVVQRALTAPDGRFRFDSLTPDQYSVRVNLSSFVPAMRGNVPVRAGMESFLNIQLANLFSSIELVYTAPGQTGVLNEDWKWVLRSSTATRPVLRVWDPQWKGATSTSASPSIFNSTSGVMRISAGDSGVSSALGSEPDLGTAFAVATSVFGDNQLRVSGNLGYASSTGSPTAGFRTRYTHGTGETISPDVELTVRQASVRQRAGAGLLFGPGNAQSEPLLRTMSVKVADRKRITEDLTLEYGALMEAVAFLQHLNVFSPYARLGYALSEGDLIEFAFSSGVPALDLMGGGAESDAQDSLTGLAMFPRLSLDNGRVRVQRNETYEVGYRKIAGSRTYSASVFQDFTRDGAITAATSGGANAMPDLLPDLASNSSVVHSGNFQSFGYSASVTQSFWDRWSATFALGAAGALTATSRDLEANDPAELRAVLRSVRRPWASARLNGLVPATGTRFIASYLWTTNGTLGSTHAYLTQRWQPQMGLNLQFRQPLPAIGGIPGRLEMTAELRNLLAQGYIPMTSPDGGSLLLIQFPRTIRGGFSFIF